MNSKEDGKVNPNTPEDVTWGIAPTSKNLFFNQLGLPVNFECVFSNESSHTSSLQRLGAVCHILLMKENVTETSLVKIRKLVDEINVLDQSEIDQLKKMFPGQGVGPEVQRKLFGMIKSGQISARHELPQEYRIFLSGFINVNHIRCEEWFGDSASL